MNEERPLGRPSDPAAAKRLNHSQAARVPLPTQDLDPLPVGSIADLPGGVGALDPERAAVHSALWGSVEQFDDLAPEVYPDMFDDPWCRAVVEAMLRLWRRNFATDIVTVFRQMVSDGTVRDCNEDAFKLYLWDVDRAGGRLEGLAHYLYAVRQEQERRRLRNVLVSLADTLEHDDGPARVRQRLREAV